MSEPRMVPIQVQISPLRIQYGHSNGTPPPPVEDIKKWDILHPNEKIDLAGTNYNESPYTHIVYIYICVC